MKKEEKKMMPMFSFQAGTAERLQSEIDCELEEERGVNRKVYRMKDGSNMMAISGEPIHYWNEKKKKYEELGSGLRVGAKGLYGKRGSYCVVLPDGEKNPGRVQVKNGTYSMEWEYLGTGDAMGDEMKAFAAPLVGYTDVHPAYRKKKGSPAYGRHALARYADVEEGVDIEYELSGDRLKENIVIRTCREAYDFVFRLRVNGVVPVLREGGRAIDFYSGKNEEEGREKIFRIPAPLMTDAVGMHSEAVVYRLEECGGGYLFHIQPDAAWIGAPERTLPVTVDPVVEFTNMIAGKVTYQNSIGGLEGIGVGNNGAATWGSLIYADISGIPGDAAVDYAMLGLTQLRSWGNPNFCWELAFRDMVYMGGVGEDDVAAFNVTDAVTYARERGACSCIFSLRPTYTKTPGKVPDDECCCGDSGSGGICRYLAMTRRAYAYDPCGSTGGDSCGGTGGNTGGSTGSGDCGGTGGNTGGSTSGDSCGGTGGNTGGSTGTPTNPCNPCDPCVPSGSGGSETGGVAIPYGSVEFDGKNVVFLIQYRAKGEYVDNPSVIPVTINNGPVNDQINLSTGELIYQMEDVATGSAAFPFAVSHYFDFGRWDKRNTYGKGWQLSLDQSVEMLYGYTADARYIDGSGKTHYFVSTGTLGGNEMKDTSGLDLTLTHNYPKTVIKDKNGGQLIFGVNGILYEILDASGNKITITRGTNNRVERVEDNFGRVIVMAYNGNGWLETMTDPSGRTVTYTYNGNGSLSAVQYPDGAVMEFTYDSAHHLTQVRQPDHTRVVYTYQYNRVIRTAKYSVGSDKAEEYQNYNYRGTRSTAVSDRTGIRKVYVFDDTGRTELEYEDVPLEVDGEKISNRFQVTGTVVYQYADQKRTFASSIRAVDESANLIVDGSFEQEQNSPWQLIGEKATCDGIVYSGVTDKESADKMRSYRVFGVAYAEKYLKQTISGSRIPALRGDTLILSAWAKARSMDTQALKGPRFEIRAELRYTDNTTEEMRAPYDSGYAGWQYAALPIRLKKDKTVDSITVYLDYSKNTGECLFDQVRLVNAPATSMNNETKLTEKRTVFGVEKLIKERVTTYDGIYTVVEEKDSFDNTVYRKVTDLDGNVFENVFAYNSAHQVMRSQNERGIMTEYTYNSCGMQTSVKSYACPTFNPRVMPTPEEYFKQETTYDSTGEFAVSVGDQRSAEIKTENEYNTTKGLLMSTTTPNGAKTEYTYDAASDLVKSVRASVGGAEYSILYGYTNRKLTSITHNGFDYEFTYDGMGRAKKVKIAGTDYTENDYVLTDTTTVTTSYAGGEKMTVETDRHEQPVKRTYTDKNGVETVIAEGEYDSLGKPVKVLDKIAEKTYTYTYDHYENVTSEKVNGAAFKEYGYDDHNRLKSTTFHVGNETQTYCPIYDKRADGAIYSDNAVVGVTLDGVFTSKAAQDSHGRVTEKTLTMADGRALLSEGYGYLSTQLGFEKRLTTLVETLTRKVGNTVKDTLTYTYDNNGNITEVKNGSESLAKYAYDGMNQLIREDNKALNKSWTFQYDTAGNILSKKEYAYTTGNLGAVIHTDTYTYAASGWKDRLTSFNGQSIVYDALGNPTTYRGHALTWGKIRQLEKYDGHTFKYDASGVRVQKDDITYQLDGTKILQEVRPDATLSYYYNNDGVCGFGYNGVNYYYEKNLQGDITAIYDESGNLKAEYQYDAWGNHTVVTDIGGIGTLNPFRYRGYYYDTEIGLYYLNSRYYDPQTGRFINADDADCLGADGTLLSYNLFAYCVNNPADRFDADGNWSMPNWAKVVVGAVAIAGLAVATVCTGGAAAAVCGAALSGAIAGGASGAVMGAIGGGISGGWKGALDGACSGFMTGTLIGGITGAASAGMNIATGATNVVGKAHGSVFHKLASNMEAGKMASSGQYSQIGINKALKTMGMNGTSRPDVIGVAKHGMNKLVEVVSPRQSINYITNKMSNMLSNNAGSSGKIVTWVRHLFR